ncbi:DUF4245 domain-containing protein [Streptomyces sp. 6N223]|uniref:DUF4245 domain-containing protein n=1 Tax=Streptomyces sp. 6N223 TaxID=3457412 RepID=UPI003FD1A31F
MASETATDTEAPETPETPESTGAHPNRRPNFRRARDMVLSMAVLCVGALFLYLFIPHDSSKDTVPQPVEFEVAALTAARAAPYELLVPHGLGERWRATSVRYEAQGQFGATWRLGFVTPDDEYAALAQTDGRAKGFVAEITQHAEATELHLRIDGERWEIYQGPKYDALVLQRPGVTTVVFGTAPVDTPSDSLSRFAGSLGPPS